MHIAAPDAPTSRHAGAVSPRAVGLAACVVGCYAAWLYHAAGLTLSHYDAKAHLVVARRVVDNLTPGWQQLGAVWLPLPHLLNLLPVQIDTFYRTGASAVAISIVAFAIAAFGVARVILAATGSSTAAAAGAAVLVLNQDLLYLQSTPMTEALLIGLLVMAVALTLDWIARVRAAGDTRPTPARTAGARWLAGLAIAAAVLTRYEAWPVTAAILGLSFVALRVGGTTRREAAREALRLAVYPALAAALFFVQSRLTVGRWFVTGGFFVPDNIDTGNPFRAIGSVWWGGHVVAGYGVEIAAAAGALLCVITAMRDRRRAWLLVPLALFAVGALPAYAFFDGHPFRIRYMTPLVPGMAVCAGLGIGLLRARARPLAVAVLMALLVLEAPPFGFDAPMIREAQWDSGNSAARREITRYLTRRYDGRPILASMGSLAHYMQELSVAGFHLKDFVHEGNGEMWQRALGNPRPHVGWILIEEWAEGGDLLAALARDNPRFLEGFDRVAEGGGVALYRAGRTDADRPGGGAAMAEKAGRADGTVAIGSSGSRGHHGSRDRTSATR